MSMHVNLARFVTRLVPRAGPSHAAQSCHSWHIVSRAVASPVAALVTSDDVEVTVAAAVAAAGISEAGSAQQQLCQRLRDNWYYKAGDVAAMSMEEVRLLHIPVRLWATIKSMTCSQSGAASRPASDGLSDLTGIASVVITPATRPAASQALPPQQHAQQHQEGQAPQEVLPAGSSGPADAYGTAPSLSQPLPKDILQRRMPRSRTPAVTAQHVTVRLRQIPAHKEPYGLTVSWWEQGSCKVFPAACLPAFWIVYWCIIRSEDSRVSILVAELQASRICMRCNCSAAGTGLPLAFNKTPKAGLLCLTLLATGQRLDRSAAARVHKAAAVQLWCVLWTESATSAASVIHSL
eukprot:GHRR01013747.1.p1 GENE.GHRR01013747.1~~GHRR01013747.1.p1  ORF type:complete len:350 (+),score=87.40 GHRR01013747.1:161-1210(+)